MDNQQIATIFQEIGDLLEIDGANRFRVIAYRNASENILGMGKEIKDIWLNDEEGLDKIPGIGEDLKKKIEEMLLTGLCQYHHNLLKKYGRGVLDMLAIRSVGPKKVALFYRMLGIDNLDKLKKAALAGSLANLPRMGEKSQAEILNAIEDYYKYSKRMILSEALKAAETIISHIRRSPYIEQIQYAGSLRRCKETVGDLDILASPKDILDAEKIITHFQTYPNIKNIIQSGPTKSSVILNTSVQVDLRVVEKKSFGAALHYFTGSKEHNVEIRSLAQKKGLKINEYGVYQIYKEKNEIPKEKFLIGDSEEKLFKKVNLKFIPPVLRENRGEFKAASENNLPKLLNISDIQGDLNINTNQGLGKHDLNQIINEAKKRNFKYIGISDLFNSPELPSIFDNEELKIQLQCIDQRSKQKSFKILKGLKLPIQKDGSLFFPNEKLLNQLDYIAVEIRNHFQLPEKIQTERILKALKANSKIKFLLSPTTRILNEREPIAVDWKTIFSFCSKHHIYPEICTNPQKADLPDNLIKYAITLNCKLALNSNLINLEDFDNLKFGVWQAQRGWAGKKHIINTTAILKI